MKKSNKLTFTKIKKRTDTKGIVFVKHISDNRLLIKICKEFIKLNNKMKNSV